MRELIYNLSIGNPKRVYQTIIFTIISNIINIIPMMMAILVANILIEWFISKQPLEINKLINIAIFLFIYLIVMYMGEVGAYRKSYRDAYDLSAKGRIMLAEKLRKLPLGYFDQRDPGELVNMVMGDFAQVEQGISHYLPQLVAGFFMPLLAFIGLVFWDAHMAIAMFAPLPLSLLVLVASAKLQNKLSQKHMESKIDAGNRLQEYLNGIRVIKAHNMVGSKFDRLEKSFRLFKRDSLRLEAILGPFAMLSVGLVKGGLTLMIMAGTYLMIGGKLDLLTFIGFLILGTRVYDPLMTAFINFFQLRYDVLAGKRIMDLMEEEEMDGNTLLPESYEISLEDVSFAYEDKNVLNHINLKIPHGAMTAVVGPSGSGKTTLMKLISRFYDPEDGKILFGGIDAKKIEPETLMKNISFIFQDVYLFKDTIRNNIAFGKDNPTEEEIIEAAKKASAHEFIMTLPKGYDTLVGEGGSTLSGGEKQRISIARSFLKDAPVVILDEATASLDPENEVEVKKAVNRLIKGRTVLAIAHKLNTIENADQIVVLKDGVIEEIGTHKSLLKKNGLYKKLWKLQNESQGWRLV